VRRAAHIDENQPDIVKALRQIGCSVQSLAAVGQGVPDLLWGLRGFNGLIEVKNPEQPPNKRALKPDQVTFHRDWRGHIDVVETPEQAIAAVKRRVL